MKQRFAVASTIFFIVFAIVTFADIGLLSASREGNVEKYRQIDAFALAASPRIENSLDTLAYFLAAGGKDDESKARAIYRWITDRISYDTAMAASGIVTGQDAQTVLLKRRAVCSGYSALFEALATKVGLKVQIVTGIAKNSQGSKRHAWNAVQLGGKWRLLDATWGAGRVDGSDGLWKKRFSGYYFDTKPEELVWTHLPESSQWQLLQHPIDAKDFIAHADIWSELYESGIQLMSGKKDLPWYIHEISLSAPENVFVSAKLIETGVRYLPNENVLSIKKGTRWTIHIAPPQPGNYTIEVYAGTITSADHSPTSTIVARYSQKVTRWGVEESNFPFAYGDYYSRSVELVSPQEGEVKTGRRSHFELKVPNALDVKIVNGNDWHAMTKRGDVFYVDLVPVTAGALSVVARFNATNSYSTILKYRVK